jgi:putative SOS response-associated peptidase YedK
MKEQAAPALLDVLCEAVDARAPHYNIAPHQNAPVLLSRDGRVAVEELRWGLVPFWARDVRIGDHAINAQMETAAGKPMFRAAFKARRCLVPASGYFAWKAEAGGKQPYFIRDPHGDLLVLAGLWEYWKGADGAAPLRSFTILTGPMLPSLKPLHERMPVVLAPDLWRDWLEAPAAVAGALLAGNPDPELEAYPVSRDVGSPRHDRPGLVEPLA